jgi:hypothetical protein
MTPDCTQLSSLSSIDHPLVVQKADGTSLPVTGRGVLSTSSFHVPTVSHVPNLTMQLMSAGQITDHGCRIILESDSCCVQDLRTGLRVGTGPRRHDSQRLWELNWLRLPSSTSPAPVVAASATAPTFAQWHRRLGHLSGSRLSNLVGSGVFLCLVILHFTVWVANLVNSCNSLIHLVTLYRSILLISFTLMYGGLLLLSRKGVTPIMLFSSMIIQSLPGSILCPLVASFYLSTSNLLL